MEAFLYTCKTLPRTSVTVAREYRKKLDHDATLTGGDAAFVPWQGHDFSFLGMAGWRP